MYTIRHFQSVNFSSILKCTCNLLESDFYINNEAKSRTFALFSMKYAVEKRRQHIGIAVIKYVRSHSFISGIHGERRGHFLPHLRADVVWDARGGESLSRSLPTTPTDPRINNSRARTRASGSCATADALHASRPLSSLSLFLYVHVYLDENPRARDVTSLHA